METYEKKPQNYEDIDRLNLCIIPTTSQKIPIDKWKQYQQQLAPISHWRNHYCDGGYVGVITGKISKNLEIVDVDVKNDPQKLIYKDYIKLIPENLLNKLIIQTTPNAGYHFIYRCPYVNIEPSQKLALSESGEVIIETRGEGGYFCHHLKDYKVIQGKFDLVNYNIEIPELTPDERETLLITARSLTKYTTPKDDHQFIYSESAINEYNKKFNAVELFIKHGWTVYKEDNDKFYLTRPDSSALYSGYYYKNTQKFLCYSSSTDFTVQKPYNNFQILMLMEGKNDYKTTLRILKGLGYEVQEKRETVSPDDIAEYLNSIGIRYDTFVQDTTYKGEVLEERDYNTIFLDMKKNFATEIPRSRYDDVIKSKYIQAFNPIEEFIEKNKERQVAGTFEKWFDCLHLKNENIDRAIALEYIKKWYVGIISQALGGQFANEYFLTLISTEQGIGKTTLLREYTIPQELQKYVVEQSLTYDDDFMVVMSQSVLVIDDEMDGKTWNTMNTFKTILSKKKSTLRRKYDRKISTLLRRCSFAGSGNHLNIIKEYQNRRIIPLELKWIDHKKLRQIDLVDLFMEAFHMFKNGYIYSFKQSDNENLRHLYEDYVQLSDLDLLIDQYIEKPKEPNDIWLITVLDIITALNSKYPQFGKRINNPSLIGTMMADRGFIKERKTNKRFTCYQISVCSKILELLHMDAQSMIMSQLEKAESIKDLLKLKSDLKN